MLATVTCIASCYLPPVYADSYTEKIAAAEDALAMAIADVEMITQEIDKTNEEIKVLEAEYETAVQKQQETTEDQQKQIRYICEQSSTENLSQAIQILQNSDSFSEAITTIEYTQNHTEYQQGLIQEYIKVQKDISDRKKELEIKRSEMETTKKELEECKARRQQELNKAKQEYTDYQQRLKEAEARVRQRQLAAGRNANIVFSDISGYSGKGVDIVQYALQFVGNPYQYEGTSLTHGCDCSGFVMSVYAAFGYNPQRTSYAQELAGRPVSYSEAQPGDVIIYPNHATIYVGNRMIAHASCKAEGITTGSATYRSFTSIRRIIN